MMYLKWPKWFAFIVSIAIGLDAGAAQPIGPQLNAAKHDSKQVAKQSDSIDFDTQIIPVLTRYGCNSGACHGAAIGRGGFKLSLFGSRSQHDHLSISRELEGRRLNLDDADASLLLRKASESMEHGGGERFDSSSNAYEIVSRWISDGGKRLQRRKLIDVQVSPTKALLKDVNDTVTVSVVATFDDGTKEDVTHLTVLMSDDPESVSVDIQKGELQVLRRGEHLVIARYLDRVQAIRIGVPIGNGDPRDQIVAEETAVEAGTIDWFVNRKLGELKIIASPRADDHEFARRLWLDLSGRLPTVEELDQFVGDDATDKRSQWVDRLLDTDDFADLWALKWANVLAIDSKTLQPQGAQAYHGWLTKHFRQDASWNTAAYSMLTGSGDSFLVGPVNFLRTGKGPDGLAESATRIFMGVRLRCANCHDHPLDHWSQDDYHGLAAVFAKLKRGRVVSVTDRGEVTHPVTGQSAIPRIPGTRDLADGIDGRVEFARWVVDPTNPYFARAAVNRIWAQLMGRGLIDPVDDIRATNPASHPELLGSLANQFIEHEFRFKPMIRLICNSRAYGRTSQSSSGNKTDAIYYSHFLSRPLEAEVIANAIGDVTGVEINYHADGGQESDQESGTEVLVDAIRLSDNRMKSETLDILGRCDREEACETPSQSSGSLAKVLHFLNGDLLNDRIDSQHGRLTSLLSAKVTDIDLIESLYKTTLSRPPSSAERRYWKDQLTMVRDTSGDWQDRETRKEFFADVFWSLLTSETFLTNH